MSTSVTDTAPNGNGNGEHHIDEGFRVYVGNLPYSTTEEQIRELLKPTKVEPLTVALPMKFNRPSGYAFVAYKAEADAKKVVEQLNGHELGERKLLFEVARSKEEADVARKAAQEKRNAAREARAAEKKAQGDASGAEAGATTEGEAQPRTRAKKPRAPRRRVPEEGEEAAEGEEAQGATTAAAARPKKPRNRKPKVAADAEAGANGDAAAAKEARIDGGDEAQEGGAEKPKRERKPRAPRLALTGEQSKSTIFVANLPFSVDDDALASIFTNLSISVKSAKVVVGSRRGRPGARPFHASKGFGFVEVENPAQQAEAVTKVDGSLIGDRQISARVAHEMKPEEEVAQAQQASDAVQA